MPQRENESGSNEREIIVGEFSVIVVGAGKGDRFGGGENKIFAKIDEQPLFLKAAQLFCNREDVCETILVVSKSDMDEVKTKYGPNLGFMGVRLVEGGAERCDSVRNALAVVSAEAKFVAVHDAVRVCVAEPWIDAIFEAARGVEGIVPVTPVTSTLKRVSTEGVIEETVSRASLSMAQTPQVFRRDVIVGAYEKLSPEDAAAMTDDAQVVAQAGHAVMTTEGDARNIKITTKDDLALAKVILKALPQKAVSQRGVFEEAQW